MGKRSVTRKPRENRIKDAGKQRTDQKHKRTGSGTDAPQTPEAVIAARRRSLRNRGDVEAFLKRLVGMAVMLWILFGLVFGLALS